MYLQEKWHNTELGKKVKYNAAVFWKTLLIRSCASHVSDHQPHGSTQSCKHTHSYKCQALGGKTDSQLASIGVVFGVHKVNAFSVLHTCACAYARGLHTFWQHATCESGYTIVRLYCLWCTCCYSWWYKQKCRMEHCMCRRYFQVALPRRVAPLW